MKNIFKKIFATTVAVATMATAMIGLTSCGGNGPTANNTAFYIGGTGPLTGEAASYGKSVEQGAALAVKHINAKGGIQFTFKMLDDKAGAADAITNYGTLYDDGMQVSLGGVTSGSGEAFANLANADGVFSMSPSASADPVIKDKKYSFRLCFGDPDQGAIAAEAIKEAGYTNVGVIYDVSDPYSSGIYEAFAAKAQEVGITTNVKTFDKESNKDFSTQAEALKACDVVFMPFYYTEASLFIKKSVEKGSSAVFFGCDGFDGIAGLVTEVTNVIKYITPFDVNSTEQSVQDFVAAYTAEYGVAPDQFAADAYDVVMVIAAAIEQSGITDYTVSAEEIGSVIYDIVTSADFSYDGLTGADMTWSEGGACTKAPKIVTLGEE